MMCDGPIYVLNDLDLSLKVAFPPAHKRSLGFCLWAVSLLTGVLVKNDLGAFEHRNGLGSISYSQKNY